MAKDSDSGFTKLREQYKRQIIMVVRRFLGVKKISKDAEYLLERFVDLTIDD